VADVKAIYGEITRKAKRDHPLARRADAFSSAAAEEARLAAKIRERARADYRTITPR
jgi:hypothetical protein